MCAQAKNSEMLVECFYSLEAFSSLEKLMQALPEGNALLRSIGEKFQSVGLCNEGVSAFLKVRTSSSPPATECVWMKFLTAMDHVWLLIL